MTWKSL
jgi:L-histidine Nalpha-methyltransferase